MSITDFNIALSKIKEKIPLSKIVGQDVHLQKKGRELVGNCPFHHEKTGSFFVNDEKGTYYCFGCGASGDLIEYFMKKYSVNFSQAVEKLAEMSGVILPEKKQISHSNEITQKILQKAVEFFKDNLKKNEIAKKYCESRDINQEIIEKFSIGFSPNNNSLLDFLKQFDFSENDLKHSGMFIEKGFGLYSRFRNRLMFPLFDKKGFPIAFGGRGIEKEAIPKYLNSPESELFQKRETLYAYNIASRNVNEKTPFIIVEGYMDVVMLHKFEFNTAIASMGTAFSENHLMKIWKYSKEPIVCFDGDEAGYKAMLRLADIGLRHISSEQTLKFALLSNADDPDSFLKKNGREAFQDVLDKAFYLIDFIWNHEIANFKQITDKTPEHIAKWKKNIEIKLSQIQDVDIKTLYRKEFNNRIFELINGRKKFPSKKEKISQINLGEKILLREAILLCTLVKYPIVVPFVVESLALAEFSNADFEKLRIFILDNYLENMDFAREDLKKTIGSINDMVGKYCVFDGKDVNEIIEYWNGIFQIGFLNKAYKNELLQAKTDCKDELDNKNWERLKMLKLSSISKRNHT